MESADVRGRLIDFIDEGIVLNVIGDNLAVGGNIKSLKPDDKSFLKNNKATIIKVLSSFSGVGDEIVAFERSDYIPLSYAQQRIWFIDKMENGSPQYNMPYSFRVKGVFNLFYAESAMTEIIRRHEILRTVYREHNNEPIQVVQPAKAYEISVTDLSDSVGDSVNEHIDSLIIASASQVFDLSNDLMVRVSFIKLNSIENESEGIILFNMHHIASDGWSMKILVDEFVQLYKNSASGTPLALNKLSIQYADYAIWQKQHLNKYLIEKQIEYWRSHLNGLPPVHEIPLDFNRPKIKNYRGGRVSECLPLALSESVQRFAADHNSTLFMILHAALALVFSRYSNSTDIIIGTPVANRLKTEVEPLIGFFINTLVLRVNTKNQSLTDYVKHVRQVNVQAQSNQDIPFEQVVSLCNAERSVQYSPLFQIMFSMNTNEKSSLELDDLIMTPFGGSVQLKFDLDISAELTSSGIVIDWLFDTALFHQETIARMQQCLANVLQSMVKNPAADLSELDFISEQERYTLLWENNTLDLCDVPSMSLHQLFEKEVHAHGDSIAIVDEIRSFTYAELNKKANRLAHCILNNIPSHSYIGVRLERNSDMIVAILAILKSGNTYVPIDPKYPKSRQEHIVQDSGIACLITHKAFESDEIELHNSIFVLVLDNETTSDLLYSYSSDNPEVGRDVRPTDDAYVIYTSGSTGKPKGVLQTHANVVRLFSTTHKYFGFNQSDVWTLFHSIAFDFSVWELWGALLYGGKLVIPRFDTTRDPEAFATLCQQHRVTVLNQTPSAFSTFAQVLLSLERKLPSLRYVIFGGEALQIQTLVPWWDRFGYETKLINMYGITETTVHASFKEVTRADLGASVIGERLGDQTIYLLDDALQPVPRGAIGEIYVGGQGLATAYLNRPELTCERFLVNPYATEEMIRLGLNRLYKSGDLARYDMNNELLYMGRNDFQVKLRGFRIEIGEIEQCLLSQPNVKSTHVMLHENAVGHKQLVAYVAMKLADNESDALEQMKMSLSESLPEYMVPSIIIRIEQLPLTTNGKVNTNELPQPELAISQFQYIAPRDECEQKIVTIWSEVLGLPEEKISVNVSFFSLGGDSIRCVHLVNVLKSKGLNVRLRDFYQSQTVEKLALLIEKSPQFSEEDIPLHVLDWANEYKSHFGQDAVDCFPVSSMQALMLDNHGSKPGVYQPQLVIELLDKDFSFSRLNQVLHYLVAKNPMFNSRFMQLHDGSYLQAIIQDSNVPITQIDWRHLNIEDEESLLKNMCLDDAKSPFKLGERCYRFSVIRLASGKTALVISTHHAIEDGWGFSAFLADLHELYFGVERIEMLPIACTNIVFKEYVALEYEARQSAESKVAWQSLLKNFKPMKLTSDMDKPKTSSTMFATRFELDDALVSQLKTEAKKHGTHIKNILLTCLASAVSDVFDESQVTIDVVTNGRSERLSDPLNAIGLFWNLLPFTICSKDINIPEVVERINIQNSHSIYPIDCIRDITKTNDTSFVSFNFVDFHNAAERSSTVRSPVRFIYSSDRFHHPVNIVVDSNSDVGTVKISIDVESDFISSERVNSLKNSFVSAIMKINSK